MSGEYTEGEREYGLAPVERWGDGLLALVENSLMGRCEVEATSLVVLS